MGRVEWDRLLRIETEREGRREKLRNVKTQRVELKPEVLKLVACFDIGCSADLFLRLPLPVDSTTNSSTVAIYNHALFVVRLHLTYTEPVVNMVHVNTNAVMLGCLRYNSQNRLLSSLVVQSSILIHVIVSSRQIAQSPSCISLSSFQPGTFSSVAPKASRPSQRKNKIKGKGGNSVSVMSRIHFHISPSARLPQINLFVFSSHSMSAVCGTCSPFQARNILTTCLTLRLQMGQISH